MDPDKLSSTAREIIEDPLHAIQVSAISFWEISLKYALNKIELSGIRPDEFPAIAKEMGFETIPLLAEEAAEYYQLGVNWHKDPFDRMLIWQAIQRKVKLISKDENVAKYADIGLKVIW